MPRKFRFGICTDQNMPWPETAQRWQEFERLGFDSAWLCDHLIQPSQPEAPYFEAWTLLAALAVRTSKLRIGVLVTSNTFRHPSVLVKEIVTLDHVSAGRLDIGLGAGWYEPEHRRFGIPFPATKELVARFAEAVELIDLALRSEPISYSGIYYQVSDMRSAPGPVQKPRPPLLIAAFGPRMLKIAARYADTWNSFGSPSEMMQRNELIDVYCRKLGRDPESLDRSLYYWIATENADPWESEQAFVDILRPYIDAGMNHFIIDQPRYDQRKVLESVATNVIPELCRQRPQPTSRGVSVDSTHWQRPHDRVASTS